ncbi:MAG: S-adenosyl-l-methionine hydroxide adenosyltransferase family protein, partial [Anaerolineae bacterium]
MKVRNFGLIIMVVLLLVSSPFLYGFALPEERLRPNGLIALLTDYGEKDFYVGAVKGVIYSTFPEARVVDITHQVTPFEIHEGAVTLWLAARTFPPGTVFVAVVDPGVGTERRAIALETRNGLFFVAPDNGLLTLVMQEFGVREIREITNEEWMRQPVSYTFHGRDIFAPVGAQLAQGSPLAEVGPIVTDPIWLPIEGARVEEDRVVGQVLMIDQYGNMQANITQDLLAQIGLSVGDAVSVQVGEVVEASQFLRTYGDVPEGEDLIFIASTDL